MKNDHLKNSITYLLLVLFISMKMAGLHAVVHSDVNNNDNDPTTICLICDHAIANNLKAILTPQVLDFTIEIIETIVQKELTSNYSFLTSSTITQDQLFSRPPPFLL